MNDKTKNAPAAGTAGAGWVTRTVEIENGVIEITKFRQQDERRGGERFSDGGRAG